MLVGQIVYFLLELGYGEGMDRTDLLGFLSFHLLEVYFPYFFVFCGDLATIGFYYFFIFRLLLSK